MKFAYCPFTDHSVKTRGSPAVPSVMDCIDSFRISITYRSLLLCHVQRRGQRKGSGGSKFTKSLKRRDEPGSRSRATLEVHVFCTRDNWKFSETGGAFTSLARLVSKCADTTMASWRGTKNHRASGLPRRGGLSWVPLGAWSGLFAVWTRLTQRLGPGGEKKNQK